MSNSGDLQLNENSRVGHRAELRNVIMMSIPVVITTSSRAVMDIADFLMIAQLPTHDAQAAILPAQVIMWSYIVIGMGVVSLVSTFASQCLGRGEPRECSTYAWQSIYVGGVFGVIGVALIPFAPALVVAIGHEESVQHAEIAYLRIALLTAGPTIAANGLGWFFIGVHRPWITMWSALEANVVNVVVSATLIFGLFGFESMGIAGAAWGTVAAVTFRTVRLSATLLHPSVDKPLGSRTAWRPSWSRIKKLFRHGIPAGLQWTSEVVVWGVFINILVGRRFGTAELIATNATWQYLRIAFLPSMGVGQALTALVGKSIGAGEPERAMREVRFAVWITLAYLVALSVVYAIFGGELISLFNDDPTVVRIGAKIMICAAVFQIFDALGITYSAALRGAGDTFVPAMFFIVTTWLIIVGGGWCMIHWYPALGSLGPWLSASVFIVVTALFLRWRWQSRAWMKIDLFGTGGASRNEEGDESVEAELPLATGGSCES